MMSSVCRPTETAAYREYDVSLYSWMKLGLGRFRKLSRHIDIANTPADGLANGDKEVLRLFGDGRERLENDMTIFRADPERTRGVIGF